MQGQEEIGKEVCVEDGAKSGAGKLQQGKEGHMAGCREVHSKEVQGQEEVRQDADGEEGGRRLGRELRSCPTKRILYFKPK